MLFGDADLAIFSKNLTLNIDASQKKLQHHHKFLNNTLPIHFTQSRPLITHYQLKVIFANNCSSSITSFFSFYSELLWNILYCYFWNFFSHIMTFLEFFLTHQSSLLWRHFNQIWIWLWQTKKSYDQSPQTFPTTIVLKF